MPNPNLKLKKYQFLRSKGPIYEQRFYGHVPTKIKLKKRRIRLLGDSLSDEDKKYNETTCCIPNRWLLTPSRHGEFTDGFVWVHSFINELLFKRNKAAKGLKNINLPSVERNSGEFFINEAEGGATAFKYSGFLNFFRYLKGWIMSFFLGNIQKQATLLTSRKGSLGRDDIVIIFAGANDLATVSYPNKGGAERAVEGIHNTIKLVTQTACNSVILATVPDIGKTPRYLKKSVKKREAITEACRVLNQGIHDLAKSYQYVDFSFCDIYRVANQSDINIDEIKHDGIVITGEGRTRRVYFIKEGSFLLKGGQKVEIDITLSPQQCGIIDSAQGKVKKTSENLNELEALVSQLTEKAKLNVDIKVFDAAAKFDEIYSNPEKYGFTSGCGVYFYNGKEDLEGSKLTKIGGNAVILEPIKDGADKDEADKDEAGEYQIHIFCDKKLLPNKSLKLIVSPVEKQQLERKLKVAMSETPSGLIKLVGCEDTHDVWTTHIVQRAVENYNEKSPRERITLANIYLTMLDAMKENLPDNLRMSWDGLHPNHVVHFIFGSEFEDFFSQEYEEMDSDRKWMDDTALLKPNSGNSPSRWQETPELIRWQGAPELMIADLDDTTSKQYVGDRPEQISENLIKQVDDFNEVLATADKEREDSQLSLSSSEAPEPAMQNLDSSMDSASTISNQNKGGQIGPVPSLNSVDSLQDEITGTRTDLLAKDGYYYRNAGDQVFFSKPRAPERRLPADIKNLKHLQA
jgi:phospholipase/lecithinase/hemolysin